MAATRNENCASIMQQTYPSRHLNMFFSHGRATQTKVGVQIRKKVPEWRAIVVPLGGGEWRWVCWLDGWLDGWLGETTVGWKCERGRMEDWSAARSLNILYTYFIWSTSFASSWNLAKGVRLFGTSTLILRDIYPLSGMQYQYPLPLLSSSNFSPLLLRFSLLLFYHKSLFSFHFIMSWKYAIFAKKFLQKKTNAYFKFKIS